MSMKGITVGLIVEDLVNDTIEGRQYPAILLSIMCDALAIRGTVMSHRHYPQHSDSLVLMKCTNAEMPMSYA